MATRQGSWDTGKEMKKAARYTFTPSNAIVYHLNPLLRRLGLIYPRRLIPMLFRDLPKVDALTRESTRDLRCVHPVRIRGHRQYSGRREKSGCVRFELVRELLVVKKDPWVVILAVEPVFQLVHRSYHVVDLRVSREHDERRIFAGAR
jgi:hypothetical protein